MQVTENKQDNKRVEFPSGKIVFSNLYGASVPGTLECKILNNLTKLPHGNFPCGFANLIIFFSEVTYMKLQVSYWLVKEGHQFSCYV